MSMSKTYNEGITTGYSKHFKYTDNDFYQFENTIYDLSRPQTFEYRDFRCVKTEVTRHDTLLTITHIPTGEVVATNANYCYLAWFLYWFYRYSGRA